eukprot:8712533-Alexandrium_andersonii.AAC.1
MEGLQSQGRTDQSWVGQAAGLVQAEAAGADRAEGAAGRDTRLPAAHGVEASDTQQAEGVPRQPADQAAEAPLIGPVQAKEQPWG